jgi:hypothetical protein
MPDWDRRAELRDWWCRDCVRAGRVDVASESFDDWLDRYLPAGADAGELYASLRDAWNGGVRRASEEARLYGMHDLADEILLLEAGED